MELLQNFYETTLDALKDAKNDRLWFKTNTKLGKLYFDRSDFQRLSKILKQLHQSCQVRLLIATIYFLNCLDFGQFYPKPFHHLRVLSSMISFQTERKKKMTKRNVLNYWRVRFKFLEIVTIIFKNILVIREILRRNSIESSEST